jgi:hypothetical protein
MSSDALKQLHLAAFLYVDSQTRLLELLGRCEHTSAAAAAMISELDQLDAAVRQASKHVATSLRGEPDSEPPGFGVR